MTGYTNGAYTTPAATTLAPPPGGQLWYLWIEERLAARWLVEDLLHLACPPSFGVETWEGETRVLLIIDYPMVMPGIVRVILERVGRVGACLTTLDITGAYHRGEKALEALA